MLDDYDTGIDLGNLSSIESIISPHQNVSNKRQMTFNPNFDSYFTSYTDVKADEESTKPEKEKPPILPKFITGISERESAKRGIATHKMLQFCDFDNLLENGTKNELERLKKAEFISEEDAALVRCREIDAFIKSDLFRDIRNAKNLYRELRFNVKLPAENFTSDVEKKELLKGREILVQGVIDCLIENADGTIHLVDYKTDRLTKAELENQKAGEERLRAAHSLQLSYYSEAVKIIFGKRPNKIGVYSLHLGREIEI